MQTDDGCQHILEVFACETTLGEAAAQGFVAEYAAAPIFDGSGCAAHDYAQMVRLALQRVVVHGEDLLVVVLTRDGVGDLVEVHQLVDEHEHALVAGAHQKACKELDVVVPVVVADDARDAELAFCFSFGAIFAA